MADYKVRLVTNVEVSQELDILGVDSEDDAYEEAVIQAEGEIANSINFGSVIIIDTNVEEIEVLD